MSCFRSWSHSLLIYVKVIIRPSLWDYSKDLEDRTQKLSNCEITELHIIPGRYDLKQSGGKRASPLQPAWVTMLSIVRTDGSNQEQVTDSCKATMKKCDSVNVTLRSLTHAKLGLLRG